MIDIDDQTLKRWATGEDALNVGGTPVVLIDIRQPEEHAHEYIPGSINVPLEQLSEFDFSLYIQNKHPAIFYCAAGKRTQLVQFEIEAIGFERLFCLPGGIQQWKNCGLSTSHLTI